METIHLILSFGILVCLCERSIQYTGPDEPPEGIHLTLGNNPYIERTLMFISKKSIKTVDLMDPDHTHTVWQTYNASSKPLNITGSKEKLWIQRANLSNLEADMQYPYEISLNRASRRFFFRTWRMRNPAEPFLPEQFVFYGNIKDGSGEVPGYDMLREDIASHKYNGIVNLGNLGCGRSLHQYLLSLQGLASIAPLLTTPGEYEHQNLYQLYSQLFSMPTADWPMDKFWYSFNTEKAHIISVNTEAFVMKHDGMITAQRKWLTADLQAANNGSIRNLKNRPWIIVFTHRSFYCSGDENCTRTRGKLGELEEMFYHFGVDLVISSQDNFYERSWPVHSNVHHQTHYVNPIYPTYVSTAAFTCGKHKKRPRVLKNETWSAKRIRCHGFTTYARLKIINATHLSWEERSAHTDSTVDIFHIQQEHHGPFAVKVGHSSAVIAIVSTCAFILVVGALVIVLWARCRNFIRKKRAAKNMRYVHLNEGQLEL